MNIEIIVRKKIARLVDIDTYFICGNSDIEINFNFDEEWNAFETKTARFMFNGKHIDVIFTGNTVKAPIIKDSVQVKIGVFAGNLRTTTPATMKAKRSILCDDGSPEAPKPDVYAQLMERLNEIEKNGGGGSVGVTSENVKAALGYTPADQEDVNQLSEDIDNLQVGSGGCNCTLKDGDYNVLAINHRGYCKVAPENTIPAYILSKENGYNYVECDVSFTKDGVAVLLHNDTIDATSDGTGSISEMTYAEVLQYDFGSWKSSEYAGTKIPTFKEFITLCKNIGLHPYIELKANGAYTEEQIASVVDIVKSVGMEGKVTYISFNITYLEYVRDADGRARLGYLVYNIGDYAVNLVKALRTGNNDVFFDQGYGNVTESTLALCIENNIPLEVWTVNSESEITSMNPYITGVTSDNLIAGKVLHDASMIYTPPTTDITLQSISASYSGGNVVAGTALTDLTGIVVKGTYSNGTTATISDYTLSGEIVEGENTITVSYDGLTTTFTVIGLAEGTVLTSISASYTGGEVEAGTSLTALTGIKVTGTYSDGSTSEITGYELSGQIVDGENTITVSYNGLTTTFTVIGFTEEYVEGLLYRWNFARSMIDTVSNKEALIPNESAVNTIQNKAYNDGDGLHLETLRDFVYIKNVLAYNRTYEIDLGEVDAKYGDVEGRHGRLLMVDNKENPNEGGMVSAAAGYGFLIYRNTYGWSYYRTSGWASEVFSTDVAAFANKTIKLTIDASGVCSYYVDGESLGTFSDMTDLPTTYPHLVLGAYGNSANNTIIKALRIYEGVV